MKHEYRKSEKEFYLPPSRPTFVTIPSFNFLSIKGEGNPNNKDFSRRVETLYALSYAIRMAPKGGITIPGYSEYTVYPLEGVWDINDNAKKSGTSFSKEDLVYTIMIRQPSFVTSSTIEMAKKLKEKTHPSLLFNEVSFQTYEEGEVVQMMHVGSFDTEQDSFDQMQQFVHDNGYMRSSMLHREIYLSNIKRTVPDKLKTVLRFSVEKIK